MLRAELVVRVPTAPGSAAGAQAPVAPPPACAACRRCTPAPGYQRLDVHNSVVDPGTLVPTSRPSWRLAAPRARQVPGLIAMYGATPADVDAAQLKMKRI